MKIQPLLATYIKNNKYLSTNCCSNSPVTLPELKSDTVSFGYLYENVDKDMQIYRSISQSELNALFKGEKIHSGGYVTSDPRGWGSYNWDSGYVFDKSEPVYFVTFKKNKLSITSRRDNEKDTRYGISSYFLEDVANIREGNNAHGKLVYAENFEDAKQEDLKQKKAEIYRLKDIITNSNDNNAKELAWDELGSYTNEFPKIIELMNPHMDFNNEADVNGYAFSILKADKKIYLPQFRECLKSYLREDIRMYNKVPYFLEKYGDNGDLPLVLDLIKNKKMDKYSSGSILASIAEEKDFPNILSRLKTNDGDNLYTLAGFYSSKNTNGKYNDIFRDILNNYINVSIDDMQENDDLTGAKDFTHVVEKCASVLGKFGTTEDIKILKKYCSEKNPSYYPSGEVHDAIKEIVLRESTKEA